MYGDPPSSVTVKCRELFFRCAGQAAFSLLAGSAQGSTQSLGLWGPIWTMVSPDRRIQ